MKVTNDDDMMVTLELETDEGKMAFKMGVNDHRNWARSPETREMSQYIQDNRKFAQISVKCGDTYKRVK